MFDMPFCFFLTPRCKVLLYNENWDDSVAYTVMYGNIWNTTEIQYICFFTQQTGDSESYS